MGKKGNLIWFILCFFLLSSCHQEDAVPLPESSGAEESSWESELPQVEHQPVQSAQLALGAYPGYSFHPVLTESQVNWMLAPLMYESLVTLNADFTWDLYLCESYESNESQTVWTFHLRPGIAFSDGTPLTGEVVAQSLQLAQKSNSPYAVRMRDVVQIEGVGQSVVISLSSPNSRFPALLDIPIALGQGDRPLGTGPYRLEERDGALWLSFRPEWWNLRGLEWIPEIPLLSLNREEDLVTAFHSGDLALMSGDLTQSQELGYAGSYEVWDYNSTNILYLGFHTTQGICSDPEVRRGIARSIDRNTVADTLFAQHAQASTLPFHPDVSLFREDLAAQLEYMPLALEGLELEGKPLTLLVNIENTAKVAVANLIAAQLEKGGLQVTVKRLPWSEYMQDVRRGQFDLYLGEAYLTADFDLRPLLAPYGSLNFGHWNQPELLRAFELLRSATGGEQKRAVDSFLELFCEMVPFAPICFQNGSILTQYGRFSGLNPVQGNVFDDLSHWILQ